MLKNNEPYRYAQPDRVRAKLRHVEQATKSKDSPKPTAKPATKSEPANRLNRTYARAGLPLAQTPDEWSAGERRILEEAGVTSFAEEIHAGPPKRGRPPKTPK
jgi:hypothetical protein